MDHTSLAVIGAGPYGLATAAAAIERGIDTIVVGQPMAFWTDHMPDGMFLRSGPDWHLDAAQLHTFESFLEDRDIAVDDVDPIPLAVYLDYAAWFQTSKKLTVQPDMVTALSKPGADFELLLNSGARVRADAVVAAPGIRHFEQVPHWATSVPDGIARHSCEFVRFDDVLGARVLVVGGRQSAYEWAALLGEHGADAIDIVHRHEVPRFGRVSWKFVDEYIEATTEVPGWWRHLPKLEQQAINQRFWKVGRLSLEWWLTPRLCGDRFRRWPGTSVVDVTLGEDATTDVTLSNGRTLTVDRILFATGYKADLLNVPYLAGVADELAVVDGFPVLDESFQSSVAGLYLPGFVATRDFGPFFGFTRGCPAAASLIVRHLLDRA